MRYFILLLFFSFSLVITAQVVGDITGDEIIDANDYLLLKEYILKGNSFKEKADLDKDKAQSVRDLVILYDFLYENGTQITSLEFKEKKETVNISFGQFDSKKNSLEIRVSSKNLKAFQFEISNMGTIELLKSNSNIHILHNKIIGFNSKSNFDEELIFKLKLESGIIDELCIENSLFVDRVGNSFKVEEGDCANPSWSTAGLIKVKEDIDENDFDAFTDIDRNGKVDIKDYAVLFDYLNLNGPTPPGNHLDAKKKVRIEFVSAEKEQDYFELVLSSNDEIFAFDLSFYGLTNIIGVNNPDIEDIEFSEDRILWLGNGENGQKEVRLKVDYVELSKSKKICMRAPVFLDQNHQYFGVKLGKCYDIFVEKEIQLVVMKEKKDKPQKTVKDKKIKDSKKVKEQKEPQEKRNKLKTDNNKNDDSVDDSLTENLDNENTNDETTSKNQLSDLKKVNEISNREKKKNAEANDPESKATVKILSLNELQIKTTIGEKGQMIFNNEQKIFMIFNGLEWKKIDALPGVSIEN